MIQIICLAVLFWQTAFAQVSSTCFSRSRVYGARGGTAITDYNKLSSGTFTTSSYLAKMEVCGPLASFDGIQLFLSDSKSGVTTSLAAIGRQTDCEVWYFSRDEYINTVYIGYTDVGVHYIQIILSSGKKLERGTQLETELLFSQDFGAYQPLVGLQAYHDVGQQIKGLGFISYICGSKVQPEMPNAPLTKFLNDAINVIWSEPLNGGSEITSYTITFKASDGKYYKELSYCDGTNPSFVKYANCWIPSTRFLEDPFNLNWGDEVIAIVSASNAYGTSDESNPGGGAILISEPEAPKNLRSDESKRTKTTLGLQWDDGYDGGLQIIDYYVSYKKNDDLQWQDAQTGITNRYYDVYGLTPGQYYLFRVQARNTKGFSSPSNTLQLLCASAPEPPRFVSTSNLNDQIQITWVAPEDNGSPVQGYKIAIMQSDGVYNFNVVCTGNLADIFLKMQCNVPLSVLMSEPYSLKEGNVIRVKVAAQNSYGESQYSLFGDGASIQVKPDPPSQITSDKKENSDQQITIRWLEGESNGGSAVTQYNVYCDKGVMQWQQVSITGRDLFYVTDFALQPGKTYKFKVTATNLIGTSEYSETIEVLAATYPDHPVNLQFLPDKSNAYQISFSWESGKYDGGTPLTSFTILYSEGLNQMTVYKENVVFNNLYGQNSFTATELIPGKSYRFIVQAKNLIGLSQQSDILPALAAQKPDPPTNLSNMVTITSGEVIGVQWSAPEFNGGSQVIDYILWQKSANSDWTVVKESEFNEYSLVYGVEQGQLYTFRLQARNKLGVSDFSPEISILTAYKPKQPAPPRTRQDKDNLIVTWMKPDDGGSTITSYKVEVRISDFRTYFSANDLCTDLINIVRDTKCTIPVEKLTNTPFKLPYGTSVYAQITAGNEYGFSETSQPGNGAIIMTNPTAPRLLQEDKEKKSATSISLVWYMPDSLGGSTQVTYNVVMKNLQTGSVTLVKEGVEQTAYTVEGLTSGQKYEFRIRAKNEYGLSLDFSDSLEILCAWVPDPPPAPTTEIIDDSVIVKIKVPSDNGSQILSYKVFIQPSGVEFYEQAQCTNNDVLSKLQCVIQLSTLRVKPFNLQISDNIVSKVIATNEFGDSLMSPAGAGAGIVFKPDAPRDLVKVAASTTEIQLGWSDGQSTGGSPITYYTVYWDRGFSGSGFQKLEEQVFSKTYKTNTLLQADTAYTFVITATNSKGESDQSQPLQIIAANLPSKPLEFSVVAQDSGARSVKLSWQTPSSNGGSRITGYLITYGRVADSNDINQLTVSDANQIIIAELIAGRQYKFEIQAENRIGFSEKTDSIQYYAAQKPDPPEGFQFEKSLTTINQIGLSWLVPQFQGGYYVTEYKLWYDKGLGNDFTVLEETVQDTKYIAKNLQSGLYYQFKVQAKNQLGYSDFSQTIRVQTAMAPEKPEKPTSSIGVEDNFVTISWQKPIDNNSPIIGYTVLFMTAKGTFEPEQRYCDGQEQTILSQCTCQVPISVFRSMPFLLEWGSVIKVQVAAKNTYGSSELSEVGGDGVILTHPEAPTDIVEDVSKRTKSTLGMTWVAPTMTGGTALIDYRVEMAQAGLEFQVVKSNLADTKYEATGLTAGITYQFRVSARTDYGYSEVSKQLALLCAFKPEPPRVVTTQNQASQVLISWSNPITNGSPVINYLVYIKKAATDEYIQERNQCQGLAMIQNWQCSVPLSTLLSPTYGYTSGQLIIVKVVSVNKYGDSQFSDPINGQFQATILTKPDAPLALENDKTVTSDKVIKITWKAPDSNGGADIFDYTVFYDQGSNQFVSLASGIQSLEYQTSVQLMPNIVYKFKVAARNQVGLGVESQILEVRAAAVPQSAPQGALKFVPAGSDARQVLLDWTEWASSPSVNGGSPIISYRISYMVHLQRLRRLSISYQVYKEDITQTKLLVTGLQPGQQYSFVLQAQNLVGYSSYSYPLTITAAQPPDPPTLLRFDPTKTSATSVGLVWDQPLFNGGKKIDYYTIWYDDGVLVGDQFTVIAIEVYDTQHTLQNLVQGQTYKFYVKAYNELGYSQESNKIEVLAAQKPGMLLPPSIRQLSTDKRMIQIEWSEPSDGGSPITSYRVEIRENDKYTFSEEPLSCKVGKESNTNRIETKCEIPIANLIQEPFLLSWGSPVYARVVAINKYGESQPSSTGVGGLIMTKADPPQRLQEDQTKRTKTSIGLMWLAPLFQGGTDVTSYRVAWKGPETNNQWQVFQDQIRGNQYTLDGLVLGNKYEFRVSSLNEMGYSDPTEAIPLTCATRPEQPFDVVTANQASKIQITWKEPQNNGLPITKYKVFIARSTSVGGYSEFAQCEELNIFDTRTCTFKTTLLEMPPYSLERNDEVKAYLIAVNEIGDSYRDNALIGKGAYMFLPPDAPIKFQNNPLLTKQDSIAFTWEDGYDGGSAILDYAVYILIKDEDEDFVLHESEIKTKSYATKIDQIALDQQKMYVFTVVARNEFGESVQSRTITYEADSKSNEGFNWVPVYESEPIDPSAGQGGEGSAGGSGGSNVDSTVVAGGAAAAVIGTTAAAGLGITAIVIIAIISTLLIIVIIGVIIFFCIIRRRQKLNYPKQENDITQNPMVQVKTVNPVNRDAKVAYIDEVGEYEPGSQNHQDLIVSKDEAIQREHIKKLMKGKTMVEKMQLLTALQLEKEKELHTQYRMDRQQLRHDEKMANRKMDEQRNMEELMNDLENVRQSQDNSSRKNEDSSTKEKLKKFQTQNKFFNPQSFQSANNDSENQSRYGPVTDIRDLNMVDNEITKMMSQTEYNFGKKNSILKDEELDEIEKTLTKEPDSVQKHLTSPIDSKSNIDAVQEPHRRRYFYQSAMSPVNEERKNNQNGDLVQRQSIDLDEEERDQVTPILGSPNKALGLAKVKSLNDRSRQASPFDNPASDSDTNNNQDKPSVFTKRNINPPNALLAKPNQRPVSQTELKQTSNFGQFRGEPSLTVNSYNESAQTIDQGKKKQNTQRTIDISSNRYSELESEN